jgi:hypothetical protein
MQITCCVISVGCLLTFVCFSEVYFDVGVDTSQAHRPSLIDSATIIGRKWVHSSVDSDSSDCESGISTCSSAASLLSGSIEDFNFNGLLRHSFRIATYNVLTDLCIKPGQYLHCPQEIRYMPTRHVAIMAEVKDMSPDIVCFQVLLNIGACITRVF